MHSENLQQFNRFTSTAINAAQSAGSILRRFFARSIAIKYKGKIDPVTIADIQSQKKAISILKQAFPTHTFMGEEGKSTGKRSDPHCWIIDPLDGTVNFIHGIPFFSVSIALYMNHEIVSAVVYAPMLDELFVAQKSSGAWCNGKPIRVSSASSLTRSLAVTGFPYSIHAHSSRILKRFKNIITKTQGVRRFGSASIDLCYVACGRFDAFWEEHLKPWDVAAGSLIVEEAGGNVSDYSNKNNYLFGSSILATNSSIHKPLLSLLR